MSSNKWILVASGFVAGLIAGVLIMMVTGPSGGGSRATSNAPAPVTPAQQGPDKLKLARDIQQLEQILKTDPNNYDALVQLGNSQFDIGAPQKSIDAYRRALAIKGTDPNVWTDMGVMYRELKNFPDAVNCFRKAITFDPRHASSRYNLGVVLLHDLNDYPGAIEAWEGLLSIEPTGPRADQIREQLQELKKMAGKESDIDQAARELGKQLNQPPAK
jgi:tetratricopeptide (TPR) repeat protein